MRFFRKDGYEWRKKKDGRTVGEAHERLKVGNVDALNCYYAHGEKNPFFQRRCYWMLDPAYEHIALVHYLDVSEGRQTGSNLHMDLISDQTTDTLLNKSTTPGSEEGYGTYQNSCSPGSIEEVTSTFDSGYNHMENFELAEMPKHFSSPSHAMMSHELRKIATQLSLDDDDYRDVSGDIVHGLRQCSNQAHGPQKSWPPEYGETSLSYDKLEHPNDVSGYRTSYSRCNGGEENLNSLNKTTFTEVPGVDQGQQLYLSTMPSFHESYSTYPANEHFYTSQFNFGNEGAESLQFELAKAREFLLGPDLIDSPVKRHSPIGTEEPAHSNSNADSSSETVQKKGPEANWMDTVNFKTAGNVYSSLYSELQFHKTQHIDPAGAAISPKSVKQQFYIHEICPEWAYSSESTKVIITGNFLCSASDSSWSVMFGDIEVPVDIIQEGVLRCQAPKHHPGKVALYITSGNRKVCSEVKQFEYIISPELSYSSGHSTPYYSKSSEELLLLIRLVQTLLESDPASAKQDGSSCSETDMLRNTERRYDWSEQLIEAALVGTYSASDIIDRLLQELLKDKLQQWISMKSQNCEGTDCSLSKQDSCIIHLLSSLGYEWALNPILNSGVNVNFRDVRGWTALHWAAQFGREKMVASLLAAGALAGAVTDPTVNDPVGKTPAAVAAAHGHKGLAGYLSEVALTSHLSSLKIIERKKFKEAVISEADRAVEGISEKTVNKSFGATEEQLSLKDSLAAVRNAAQAAARIQSAFRAHSFRKRQQKITGSQFEYGMSQEEILGISKYQRSQHGARDQKYNTAALVIQKKFRGWKGRKNFLILRQNAVKIQAHVRGYQVRKNYKFHMTVSILEKVILRWRRGGVGFRGFQTASTTMDDIGDEDILKVFRKQKVDTALDEALTSVLSMVEYPEARQQYRRMLESYHHAKEKLQHAESTSAEVCWEELQTENSGDVLSPLSLEEAWANLGNIDHETL